MIGDVTEVTKLLRADIENQNKNKVKKKEEEEIKNDVKSYHADSDQLSTLDKTIRTSVESNQHEREIRSKETLEDSKCSKNTHSNGSNNK